MTKTSKLPRVKVLNDTPAAADAFGPHGRVAKAVHNLIQSEPGDKAIALEGSWGSGKSTVIKLLSKLIDPKNDSIYIFDAWSHEGDPLRRSFLEGLIEHLKAVEWSKANEWDDEKLDISRRKEETETRSVPSLTIYGKGLAFSILLAPIGLALISKNGLIDSSTTNDLKKNIGWILSLFPLIVGSFIWLYLRPTINIFSDVFWTKNRRPHDKETFLSVFARTDTEICRSVTSKSPDPTSIEFNQMFCKILDRTLEGNNRKLIVILDNLDRISPESALSIWSTMRVFFDDHRSSRADNRNRFWLIVPFDSNAISRLWNSEVAEDLGNAESFMSKSFQLIFHVAPPVLSDWKDFLLKQLEEAFPDHPVEEFHGVYRLYLLSNKKPGPRDIKTFVNEIGELYRQWYLEIPFILQAAYVLNRGSEHIVKTITDGSFLLPAHINVIGITEWQKYISALHFNVQVDKALQVLLRSDIEKSFAEGNSNLINESKVVPGFDLICEHTINENYEDWSKAEPATIGLAAKVMHDLGLESSISTSKSWSDLKNAASNVTSWKGINEKCAQGLVVLLKSCSKEESEKLIVSYLKGFSKLPVSQNGKTEGASAEWSRYAKDGIGVVVGSIIELKREDLIQAHLRVPGDANAYIDFLLKLGTKRPSNQILRTFKYSCQENSIIETLVNQANQLTFSLQHYEAIRSLNVIGYKKWENLIQAIETRLHPNSGLNGNQAIGLIKTLSYLHFAAQAKTAQQSLLNLSYNGTPHFLYLFDAEKNESYKPTAILSMMFFNPTAQGIQGHGNSHAGVALYNSIRGNPENFKELIKLIADEVIELNLVKEIIKLAKDANIEKLCKAILISAIVDRDASIAIDSKYFIEEHASIVNAIEWEKRRKIVNDLLKSSNLLTYILEQPFNKSLESAYYFMSENETVTKNEQFITYARDGLRALQIEDWNEQIKNAGDLLDLGVQLVKSGNSLSLETSFVDPVLETTKNLRKGNDISKDLSKIWSTLPEMMESAFRETFYRDVVSDFLFSPKLPINSVVSVLGDGFIKSDAISERVDELFRLTGKEILERNELEAEEIKWMSRILEINKKAKENLKNHTNETLKKRISDLQNGKTIENEEIRNSLRKFLTDLQV